MATMTGLSFVYVALPFAMAVFLLFPVPWRPGALLALSLFYYLTAHSLFLLHMVCCVAVDWAVMIVMERYEDAPLVRKGCLALSVLKSLGFIVWFQILLSRGAVVELPLGLYVVALSGMGCVLEAYRREIPGLQSPVHFALYCFYFPRLAAGPLTSYRDFAPQLESLNPSPSELVQGLSIFIQGAVKYRVLGESLAALHHSLIAIPQADASALGGWCVVLVLALSVYYRFSGCAEMARGIACMMGITLPLNFYFPYQSRSISDFFQRFNSSLVRFITAAIDPWLGGLKKVWADCLGLLLTGAGLGLWFGFSAGYLAWGVYLGLFLVMERYLYPRVLQRVPTFFLRFSSLLVVLLGFTLFGAGSLGESASLAGQMLGLGNLPLWSDRLIYLLSSNRLLLAAGLIFSTSLISRLLSFLRGRAAVFYCLMMALVSVFLCLLLSVLSI